jgi:hypothetical protein
MKTLDEKKEIIDNFEGFYITDGKILYENPDTLLENWKGNNRFEKPVIISTKYDNIMGRCTQVLTKEMLSNVLCSGATNPIANQLFNNSPQLYVLKWNEKLKLYDRKLADMDDLSQVTFQYDGNKIINWSGFELSSDENKNTTAGFVDYGNFYKIVPNNPTKQEIEDFLSNPDNCTTINLLFEQVQEFLLELLNLYQQGKIKEEIPSQWFSNTILCHEQARILNDNLLAFYVNVSPNYYQTYFKQDINIDNILKLYN